MNLLRALPAKEEQYIYPPRPKTCIPITDAAFLASAGYTAQLKYNGARCLIKYKTGGNIELWTRHAEKFRTYTAPNHVTNQLKELRDRLKLINTTWHLLDAELIDFKHASITNTIAIFDILVRDSTNLTGTTYGDRHNFLINDLDNTQSWMYVNPQKPDIHPPVDFGIKISPNLLIPRNIPGPLENWQKVWSEVVDVANAPYTTSSGVSPVLEGFLFKDPSGKLEHGRREKNNGSWQIRSRVTTGRHRF